MTWLDIDLQPFEQDLDELLEHLVAHHEKGQAQRELRLGLYKGDDEHNIATNLSEQFVNKWKQRCEEIPSITECDID